MTPIRTCLLAALLGLTGSAFATPPTASENTPALPAWDQLDATQRDLLVQPVRDRWDASPEARQRMLRHAERWRQMTPEQRDRARQGMKRWEDMSPERRAEARVFYQHMRRLPEAEREALRTRWKTMSAEERQRWLGTNRPRD
ncbi:DUF3106 domain-containing protein [Luteimonas sp. YGD11-2]|uniref:DUF3106 domain-containing protein n=1 Tax=Luteimonas sp. YGD11-2 TaxID=2508168 RepID=UPI00100A4D7F|nr:DUF3106 domain-containing protein [Luteimonas sp. YGD11-2]